MGLSGTVSDVQMIGDYTEVPGQMLVHADMRDVIG